MVLGVPGNLLLAICIVPGFFGKELLRRQWQISSSAEFAPVGERPPPERSTCAESLASSYQCQGTPGYDQSCIFHCAYLAPSDEQDDNKWEITLLLTGDAEPAGPAISDWDMPAIKVDHPVTVKVKRFASTAELQLYASNLALLQRPGLSVLFRALWQDRWAHALFDGLYPAYVSLARFGLENHVFTPVTILSNYTGGVDCRTSAAQRLGLSGAGIYTGIACQMEDAIRLFGGNGNLHQELLRINDLWEYQLQSKSVLLFDHLVSGSAHMGEYASYLGLPGTKDSSLAEEPSSSGHDFLGKFADRLVFAHGLEPPTPKPSSKDSAKRVLKVIITANKRMSSQEVRAMTDIAASGVDAPVPGYHLDVSFVDWSTVQPFKKQLQLLQQTDIMVSGIGTAMFYSAFLPFGSVCINTGWKDTLSIPTFGEEILGMSNHRTRFLYMPLDKVTAGIAKADIEEQVRRAASLIIQGFSLPIADSVENLSIFGRIIHDLGQQSESSKTGLQGRNQVDGGFLCHQRPTGQTSLSDIVFERMVDAQNLLFQLPRPVALIDACQIDVAELRQLKQKYQLAEALGIAEMSCECIACEDCGMSTE
mmetsp:Transcript_55804/g.130265  ORF Transcript_55804/g.130265 Transcript_55804/m.130265 type:complete len:592 (-) Transcript_55804:30-1805(-)